MLGGQALPGRHKRRIPVRSRLLTPLSSSSPRLRAHRVRDRDWCALHRCHRWKPGGTRFYLTVEPPLLPERRTLSAIIVSSCERNRRVLGCSTSSLLG